MSENIEKVENQYIWAESYRPSKLKDVILPAKVRETLQAYVDGDELPNFMFYSPSPGTGKTTSARVLANELGIRPLFINGSLQNSIDDVRVLIKDYATTVSLMGTNHKIVIVDECLDENEKVIVGKIGSEREVSLKDLPKDTVFDVVSMNLDTGDLENDTAEIISEREADIYEITLEDGRKIRMTDEHPAIVKKDGKLISKSLLDGLEVGDDFVIV